MSKHTFLLACAFLALLSCNRPLEPEAYVQWMKKESHGLHKVKRTALVEFDVQYKTADYLRAMEGTAPDTTGDTGLLSYFGLTLRPADGKTPILYLADAGEAAYNERNLYYNFRFRYDIALVHAGKRLECVYYVAESSGNVSPELNFTLGFDTGAPSEDLQLIVTDRVFGNGELKFLFRKKDLKNIPALAG